MCVPLVRTVIGNYFAMNIYRTVFLTIHGNNYIPVYRPALVDCGLLSHLSNSGHDNLKVRWFLLQCFKRSQEIPSLCVCDQKNTHSHIYQSNVFMKRMHTAHTFILCHQRCLLDLLSHTESAIRLVSIHAIVPHTQTQLNA